MKPGTVTRPMKRDGGPARPAVRTARSPLAAALLLAASAPLAGCYPIPSKSSEVDAGQPLPGRVDVLTQHDDVARTGQNLGETTLNTSNVNASSFGALFKLPVQGLIFAQPLVVTNTTVNGATHDVLLVATMHDIVYAFDANAAGPPLWSLSLGTPVPSSAIGPISSKTGKPFGTANIQVEIGILSTPVVDRANDLVFVTCKNWVNNVQTLWLHALSLSTGQEQPGSPVQIAAQVQGTDDDGGVHTVTFDAAYQAQRPGLLLLNDTVYMAFASHEDFQPFHGWILGYQYNRSTGKLSQTQVFNTTLDGDDGGIWQSGQGLVSDGQSIYAIVSNGTTSAQNGGTSYGESFLKLSPNLLVQDWFVPYNYEWLTKTDTDLGAGGPVLIPGTTPPLITGGGKQGVLYLVDTTSMGHMGTVDDKSTQSFQAVKYSIYASPVVWTGGAAPRLFIWGSGDVIKGYDLYKGLWRTTPAVTTVGSIATPVFPGADPVGALAVSSNGSKAGTGILWATKPNTDPDHATVPGDFYALDATTLADLWDTTQNPTRDGFGNYAKFVPPTVANGKVYLATHSQQVVVYGLLGGN